MRNIERLLKREGLPEKLRLEKQRELEKLEVIFKENKQSELERKMAVKYHKVKFFERVKITRAIEKLEKANPVEAKRPDAVTKNIESLRDDLHYVTNFPKGYKYVSVLKGDADDDAIRRKREKLRQIIKERGLADAALAEANEGGTDAAAAVVKAAGEKEKEKDDFFMESDSDSGLGLGLRTLAVDITRRYSRHALMMSSYTSSPSLVADSSSREHKICDYDILASSLL